MDLKDLLTPQDIKIDGIRLEDYVSIEPAEIVDKSSPDTAGASDLAVASGAKTGMHSAFNNKDRTFFWTNTLKTVDGIINIRGNRNSKMGQKVNEGVACARPLIRVKRSMLEKNNIDYDNTTTSAGINEVVIRDFTFPQTVVEEPLANELESSFLAAQVSGKIPSDFMAVFNDSGMVHGNVCEYDGKLYMRFDSPTPNGVGFFQNGTKPLTKKTYWFKFEPIVWLLRNNDKDDMVLCAEDGLIGNIKYHTANEKNTSLWQNSLVRSYLNGINLRESINSGNGKLKKAARINYDFSNCGFIDALQMAFDFNRNEASKYNIPKLLPIIKENQRKKVQVTNGIISENTSGDKTDERQAVQPEKQPEKQTQSEDEREEKQKKAIEDIAKAAIPEYDLEDTDSISAPKLENSENEQEEKGDDEYWNIEVSDDPLDVNEQIKFYVEHGKSFMLHGQSGIGKSRRVQDVDPDCVQIQLRDGILPEEIIGKTGFDPVNGKSFWIEPTWYTRIKEVCANDPEHNHVLFIDEITNVRPYEQSLVFHIVLEHSIDGNYGRLPKNCVVVAAGNNPRESEAAYNMPEPLFRRFSGHIYLKANMQDFLLWAGKPKKDNPTRRNIHPFIAEFVASRGLLYTDYDKDESKYAIDPRGWEQVSDIVYESKGVLDFNLIANKIGSDNARALLDFAKQPRITVSGIINGTFPKHKIPTTANGKYAMILSLVNANFEEFVKVRKFVEKYAGYEFKKVYDSLWVGSDNERAIFVNRIDGEEIEK